MSQTSAQVITETDSTDANGRLLIASSYSGRVYVKSLTGGNTNVPVVSVLTYPTSDYALDRVRPDGGDWSGYPSHPYVNWTHRIPIGRGAVNHRVLKNEGQVQPVAVGETSFFHKVADLEGIDIRRRDPRTHRSWDKEAPYTPDEVLQAAGQAERLVRDDVAPGVSIEFDVDLKRKGTDWWDLSVQSLLENRLSRHFEVYRGLGYAHARQQVNPGCMTFGGQKALSSREGAALEKAITVAQTGKLPGGEPVCEIIMKSFLDLTETVIKSMSPSQFSDKAHNSSKIAHDASASTLKNGRHKGHDFANKVKQSVTSLHQARQNKEHSSVIASHHETTSVHHANAAHAHREVGEHAAAHAHSQAADHHSAAANAHHGITTKSFLDLKDYRSSTMVLVDTAIPATPIVKAALPPVDAVAPVIVKAETQEGVSSSDDSTSSSDKKMGAGHQTLMNAAQGLKDICSQLMDNGSDDLSLRKYCKKMCTKLEDLAGDMKARAEKHKSKIDGAETTDNEDPMNEDDYEPSTEEKAITVDAVGAIITKSFPDWKPRRMTMANLVEVVSPAIPATDPAVDPETAQAALKRLSKVFKKVQPLLDAAVANGLI